VLAASAMRLSSTGRRGAASCRRRGESPFLAAALLLAGCATTDYDLSPVEVPVHSNRLGSEGEVVSAFRLEMKSILWLHGLLGERLPEIAALVAGEAKGHDAVVNFRVTRRTRFHDWLATHLSFTAIRMQTVVVEGDLVRRARSSAAE
jgi:hypothetical protein